MDNPGISVPMNQFNKVRLSVPDYSKPTNEYISYCILIDHKQCTMIIHSVVGPSMTSSDTTIPRSDAVNVINSLIDAGCKLNIC